MNFEPIYYYNLFAVIFIFLHRLYIFNSAPIMNTENPICDELIDNCDYVDINDIKNLKYSTQDLVVVQLNIRGIISKQSQLKELLLKFDRLPDALLLCETWLKKETENKIMIPGYKHYHTHRKDKMGGGVSILVRSNLRSRQRLDLNVTTKILEHQVVEMKTNKGNIFLVSGYRPPNTNSKEFLREYKTLLNALKKHKHHDLVIGMDHNFDLLKSASNTTTNQFLNLNIDTDLVPCITKPTRVTTKTTTLIDNIMVSNKLHQHQIPFVIVDDLSDHYPCLVILYNMNQCKRDKVTICKRKFTDDCFMKINAKLNSVDWSSLDQLNTSEAFEKFHTELTRIIDEICPMKEYKIRRDKIIRDPWVTKGLQNSLKTQKRLYKDHLRLKTNDSIYKYKSYRNLLNKLLRSCKLTYFSKKCVELKQNSKKLWQLINEVIGKKQTKSHMIESLKINNLSVYSPKEITNGFCTHFATVGKRYAEKVGTPRVLVETYIDKIPHSDRSMYMHPTDAGEIKSLIQLLPSKASSGFDDISNILLKKIYHSILNPLCTIFNKSMSTGVFPDLMKLADISPLFKSKLEHDTNNYRPISLLITLSKVLEKIVHKRVYTFMETTGQIYRSQYGFRSQHSCENAVSELISEITKGFQNGFYTAALFLDLSKAFDTLEHEVLLKKLEKYGIRGVCLEWFKSYLCDRKIRVKCQVASSGKTEYSDYQTVNYGTPQGSCLGPLIFLLFTNDLHKHLNHCASLLFADDTTLYKTHRNLNYLKWCLQDDMNALVDWFKANRLTLNLDKTICILFQPNGSDKKMEIEIENVTVCNSVVTRFLGMWLDQHLTWSCHYRNLLTKLNRNICLLKHCSKIMTIDCKKLVYFAHIQSHINYGLVLWGNVLTDGQLNKLTKIQLKCLKHIDNSDDFKKNKILKAADLLFLENCKFGYKLVHDQLPKKIKDACMFDNNKTSLHKTHGYNTRNKKVPNIPVKMNKQYRSSFLNKGSQSILTLNSALKEKPNIKSFSSSLKTYIISKY